MDEKYLDQAKLVLKILSFLSSYPQFALKGGTAINFFIRQFPRLSVDIDLAYLPISDRPETLTAISDILTRLTADITKKYPDYLIQPKKLENKTIALRISDRNVTIKVEPNLIIRGSVFDSEVLQLNETAEEELKLFVSARCLSVADLYGGKICAALDRQHPRDLFDVKLLLENEGITTQIRQAFIVYLMSHSRPIAELLVPNLLKIESLFKTEFNGMTRIPVSIEELEQTRENLLDILKQELTDREKQFILSFKQGKPIWEYFPVDGIEHLPAIQWKLFNIRRMPKSKHSAALDKLKEILII
ncbi:nucleotidyl transferase AbiEii/AbiGii toxin family protein [bacterium]